MKVIKLFLLFGIFFITKVCSQSIKFSPNRTVINLYFNQHTLSIADSIEVKRFYPNGVSETNVVAKVVDSARAFRVFQCTPEEYNFLKKQLKSNNIQIVLDDEIFIGFSKIVYYQ